MTTGVTLENTRGLLEYCIIIGHYFVYAAHDCSIRPFKAENSSIAKETMNEESKGVLVLSPLIKPRHIFLLFNSRTACALCVV